MTSKEALKDIPGILINFECLSDIHDNQDIKKQKFGIIEKDLDPCDEYRKIAEALGVALIPLFTALQKGVWYKDYKDNDKIKFTDYREENMKCKELIVPAKYTIIGLKFRDYGETWALDKEEFYKNIK